MVAVVAEYCCLDILSTSLLCSNFASPATASSVVAVSGGSAIMKATIIRKLIPAVSKFMEVSRLTRSVAFSKDQIPTYSLSHGVPLGFISPYLLRDLLRSNPTIRRSRRNSHTSSDARYGDCLSLIEEELQICRIRQTFEDMMVRSTVRGSSLVDCEQFSLHLDVENFSMTAVELRALGSFIARNSKLNVLTFSSLPIELEHAHILMESFAKEVVLGELKLHSIIFFDNRIGDDPNCIEVLVRWIKMIPSVQNVSFIRNSLLSEHMRSIADLISDHKKLRRLSLSSNGIADPSDLIRALEGLNRHSRLAEIDLSHNFLDKSAEARLKKAAPKLNKSAFAAESREKKVVINTSGNRCVKLSI